MRKPVLAAWLGGKTMAEGIEILLEIPDDRRVAEACARGERVVEAVPSTRPLFAELARRMPGCNVLGIEIRFKRTVLCARKLTRAGASNAIIARYHAGFLDDLFADGEVDGLYINHPDPWPKARHHRRRFVTKEHLAPLHRALSEVL